MPFIKTGRTYQHLFDTSRKDEKLTPVTDTQRLLPASVEHGTDDHESGGDGALAHAQNQTDCEETAEALARGMRTERDTPNEDVDATREMRRCVTRRGGWNVPHPFSDREALESKVLRILEDEVAQVEDGPEPN